MEGEDLYKVDYISVVSVLVWCGVRGIICPQLSSCSLDWQGAVTHWGELCSLSSLQLATPVWVVFFTRDGTR